MTPAPRSTSWTSGSPASRAGSWTTGASPRTSWTPSCTTRTSPRATARAPPPRTRTRSRARPPRLAAPLPRHAAVGGPVQLEFSEPMDTASVAGSFRLVPEVQGALEWADGRTVVFRPAAPLAYRTTYRVSVAGLPAAGGHLSAQGSFEFATVWPPPAVPYPFTLTFDDCASADAIQAILSALADRSLTAIFFPTGQCRDQFPWLVPALQAAGHRVCNHTYSHPDLSK